MEDLAPPLRFVLTLRMSIENGNSVQTSIRQFIEEYPENPISYLLELWLADSKNNQARQLKESPYWTSWRQIVLDLVSLGLKGVPILEDVKQIEKDLAVACDEQISKALNTLPFIALIPILFLQFPAYLVLLLGPWLTELLSQLK
ncbi:MAG: hypothetical protein IPK68_18100 [Bdellovibrionales bacterium]|nr:hypothetical protein [Bdellovibrionales bacterium]